MDVKTTFKKGTNSGRTGRFLLLVVLTLAFAWLQLFIGGTRMAYALPGLCLVALAGIVAALSAYLRDSQAPRAVAASLWSVASVVVFAAYIFVRNRVSEIEYIARLQFFIMAGALVVYLIFTFVLTGPQERKAFLYMLMVLAVVQVLVGVYQFFHTNMWMPLPWAQRRGAEALRSSGLFISPNNFAGYLGTVGMFAIAFTLWARIKITERVLVAYVALLCAAGVALSGSRGGYVAYAAGCGVLLLMSLVAWAKLRPRQFAWILIASVVAAAGVFAAGIALMLKNPMMQARLLSISGFNTNVRWLMWESAIEQWKLNPWWGTGGFSYLYYGRLFRSPKVQQDPIHVHNDYLQLLAEYGLVAAAIFLVVLFIHLMVARRAFRDNIRSAQEGMQTSSTVIAINIGAIAALVCGLVHAIVEFNIHVPVNAFAMAAVFGMLANGYRPVVPMDGESLPPVPRMNKFYSYIFLPATCVALLAYAVPMLFPEYYSERARLGLRDAQNVVAKPPKHDSENELAVLREKYIDEGLAYAERGIVLAPENPDLYFYAGSLFMEKARLAKDDETYRELLKKAVAYFERAEGIFPSDSTLLLKLAEAHSYLEDFPSALKALDRAEKWDPQSGLVHLYRGYVWKDIGALGVAEEYFRKAQGSVAGRAARAALQDLRALRKREAEIDKGVLSIFQPQKNQPSKPSPPTPTLPPDTAPSTLSLDFVPSLE